MRASCLDKKTISLLRASLDKAGEKLKVAPTLFKNGSYEDAVSRAYYSAFHAAQALLLTEGLNASTHQGLVNLFGLHLVKTGKFDKKFGRYLANLKDDRETSDYEVYSTIDRKAAKQAVQEAKEFLKTAKEYLLPFLDMRFLGWDNDKDAAYDKL